MAEKTINVQYKLRHDTLANWSGKNPILADGEPAIVVIPANSGTGLNEPAVLLKIGDGTTAFNSLGYSAAIAADVHAWAKAETKPTYSANEITGLADYISGEIQDTDTQYKLEQDSTDGHVIKLYSKALGGDWTVAATITTVDTVYNDTALAGRVSSLETLVGNTAVATQIANAIAALKLSDTYDAKGSADAALAAAKTYADGKDTAIAAAQSAADAAQDDVDALAEKVGTVTDGKTVVQMIADAQSAATYDDTALAGRVTTVEGKVTTLVGADTGKSVRAIANEELAAQLIPDNAKESLDTLSEIAAWIQAHPDDASAMNAAITALEAILEGIGGDGEKATVVAYVTDAIAALNIGSYAKAADLTALAARVTTVEGKVTTLETQVGTINDTALFESDTLILDGGNA